MTQVQISCLACEERRKKDLEDKKKASKFAVVAGLIGLILFSCFFSVSLYQQGLKDAKEFSSIGK